jgi:hypothetical protein
MNNLVNCNCGLASMSDEVDSDLPRSSVPLTTRKVPLIVESQSSHRKYHLDPAAWVLSGEINAMNILVHCNCGLATMSGDVDVRFTALLSPFDRTQGSVYYGKSVKSPEISPRSSGVGASR